jgi:prepilin-type processing-associated H-X9-DG protein
MRNHLSVRKHFATGGWGYIWVGDPDRGFDEHQPGGWVYNILPYLEQQALYELGAGKSPAEKRADAARVTETCLPVMNCPTRRQPVPYTAYWGGGYNAHNADRVPAHARSDYAVNAGHVGPLNHAGPPDLETGDGSWNWPSWAPHQTGISFLRSTLPESRVRDGMSNTYLVGEKYINPDNYDTGYDGADNLSMYEGHDWDVNRWANENLPPRLDRPGVAAYSNFGSAHLAGCNFVFCDGSVRLISYSIDKQTHQRLGNRQDGEPVDAGQL